MAYLILNFLCLFQGHFVRGIILFNLNLPKEALISFCISASLGHSTQLVKKHITLVRLSFI